MPLSVVWNSDQDGVERAIRHDESNPVRGVDAFVDALCLAELGFDDVDWRRSSASLVG